MKVVDDIHYFEGIADFIHTVKSASTIPGRREDSMSTGDDSWYGTSSLEEAWNLLEKGDQEFSLEVTKEIESLQLENQKPQIVRDVVGHQVVVPDYLMGIPTNMLRIEKRNVQDKVINVLINNSVSAGVSSSYIKKKSIEIVTYIARAEALGFRVNLYKMIGANSSSGNMIGFIRLKRDGEPLNIHKLGFPLTHPSMQRRLDFRFRECFGENDVTHDGYGSQHAWTKDFVKPLFARMCRDDFIFVNLQHIYDGRDNLEELFQAVVKEED